MGEINTFPCTPWCTMSDIELAPGFNPDDQIEPVVFTNMIDLATRILDSFSAHQFPGLCTKTVRPARRNSFNALLGFGWSSNYSTIDPSGWNSSWGFCGCDAGGYDQCSCQGIDSIKLGGYPLVSIQSVKVDGATLAASTYRIDNFQYLVRTDGHSWPVTQDLSLPSTSLNTFEVQFTYGHSIPVGVTAIAAHFALELAKGYSNIECRLPQRVQQVTRQGVTVAFIDTMEFFKKNKTGIYDVDMWLQSVNPYGITQSAVIVSPDVPAPSRQINT